MSSRHKRRGSPYPSPWSEWVWSEEYSRHFRSRQRGPEDWDYESEVPEVQASPNTPRTTSEEDTLGLAPESYAQQKNYTIETAAKVDVDTLTQGFAQSSISEPATTNTTSTQSYNAQSPYSGQYSSCGSSVGPFPIAVTYPVQSSPPQILASYASETSFAGAPANYAQLYASPSTNWQHHIRKTNPDTDREKFDPHYKVHGAWEFKFGKIFKVLWKAPSLPNNSDADSAYYSIDSTSRDQRDTFSVVRRFVIIKPMDGHCICLPIVTYSRQGVNKSGVNAENHAIIYSGKKPVAFGGEKEKGLKMRSIKVTPDNPRHKLDDASRLDYARPYTVEYNVKAWFIGKVHRDSEWQIRTDFRFFNHQNFLPEISTEPTSSAENTAFGVKTHIDDVSKALLPPLVQQIHTSLLHCWPFPSAKSSQQPLSYGIEWGLESFIENHVKDPTKIGELVTLTGEAVNAEALSTREYISRTYEHTGALLLEGIELALLHKSNLCIQNQAVKLEFNFTKDSPSGKPQVSLIVTAVFETHVQIATAVSWMCASFQTSPEAEITMSSISVTTSVSTPKNRPVITIRPDVLRKPSVGSCWHALFPNRVIAEGFPFRAREQGVGLEVSFQNMARASRCLSFVEYENGLVAHGLSSILVPMKELDKDRAIQWHFEDKRKQKPYKLARISQVLSSSPAMQDRLKGLQADDLIGRRCFLGLAEHANVVIGTKDYQKTFLPSRSAYAPKEACVKSQSLTVEPGFMGFFGANGTYSRTSISLQSTISSGQRWEIEEILESGSENLALFFDTTKMIGWYIPQISLVLQMTHAIISMRKYRIYDGDSEISEGDNCRTFAQPGPDAATEAAMAVKNCLRFRIQKNQFSKSKPVFEDFGDMFERVWDTLSNVEAGLESAESGFRLAGHVAPKFIHGVEFLDAAHKKPSTRIKTAKVDQAWAHLTSEHPLVIFSRDIEPPIVLEPSSLCGPWQVVPSKQSYLVSMGLAITPILDRRSEGLADGLDWNFRTELIQTHKSGRTVPVNHVQKLVSRKKTRSNSPIRREILKYPTGCFVFGPDAESECKESTVAPRDHTSWASAASVTASPTMLTLGKQTQVSSKMEIRVEVPLQPASTSKHQNSAAIRLMEGQNDPQYVFNGPSHSANLGSRSLDGSAQSKRTPRIKSALDKLLSKKQDYGLPSKLLEQAEQAELERLGTESVDAGEYDDLYNA